MHLKKGGLDRKNQVRDVCPLLFSSILCPVDLSKPSEETIQSLLQFPQKSRVILLHVIKTAESPKHVDLLRRRAQTRLEEMKENLEKHKINFQWIDIEIDQQAEVLVRRINHGEIIVPTILFPDGTTDRFNILRPIIGYGPETMYVAYNQFYNPNLGQVEKRNASPDRAHNETWDSIVITGLAGLFVYLAIFSSIFYYGLKWLGLVRSKNNRILFFPCFFISSSL
jgi:hypothetical protein